jgi:hypothetical protein
MYLGIDNLSDILDWYVDIILSFSGYLFLYMKAVAENGSFFGDMLSADLLNVWGDAP